MKIEATVMSLSIAAYAEQARSLEAIGYDSVVAPEAGHDPFLPLMTVAEHTQTLKFGTAVAIAFPRSPMVTAQLAWDLQRFSHAGERPQRAPLLDALALAARPAPARLSRHAEGDLQDVPDERAPVSRGAPLSLHADLAVLQPRPEPGRTRPDLHLRRQPLQLPARRRALRRHPHAPLQHREVHEGSDRPGDRRGGEVPAIEEGAKKAGRDISEIDLVGGNFIITGANEEEVERAKAPIRQQLSFYASTRVYHPVLKAHGWEEAGEQLFRLSMEGKWPEMAAVITDEMLEEFAIIGTYDELVPKIKARFGGVISTLSFGLGFGAHTAQNDERLTAIIEEPPPALPRLGR